MAFNLADYPDIKSRQAIALKHGFAVFKGNQTTPIYNLAANEPNRSKTKMGNFYMEAVEGLRRELDDMKWLAEYENREPNAVEKARVKAISEEIVHLEACIKLDGEKTPDVKGYQVSEVYARTCGIPIADDKRPLIFDTPPGTPRGKLYKDLFPGARLDNGGFKSCEEFLRVVNSQRFDPRLVKAATMVEGTPSLGGFSVPTEYSAKWLDAALPEEIIRPRCQVWPMASATRKIPGWDDFDQSAGAMFGGFAMEFLAEEGAGTYQSGKLRQIQLTAKKGAIFAQVSNELIADGLGFEAQLEAALVGSIRYGFDRYCLRGSGAGQPLGILNSGSLITVNKETDQDSDSLTYQNLCDMWARMYDPCRARSVWIASSSIVPQLFVMGLTLGTSGAPVYVPAGGAAGTPNDTLFGRPLLFSTVMSALGDLGDILLVDLTQYAFGIRKEMSLDRSQHVGFQKDLDTWRVIVRFDGMPTWSSMVTPEYGATQS